MPSKMELPDHVKDYNYTQMDALAKLKTHIVLMCMIWLQRHAPLALQFIRIQFPVSWHSFLPADRAFDRVEKLIGAQSMIKSLGALF